MVRRYQWEEAAELLANGLRTYPESASLLLQLGALTTKVGHPVEGETLLRKALSLNSASPEVWYHIADAQLRQGQGTAAVGLFRKALQLDPDNPRYHYRLAYTLFTRGQEQAALKSVQEATEAKARRSGYPPALCNPATARR